MILLLAIYVGEEELYLCCGPIPAQFHIFKIFIGKEGMCPTHF